MLPVGQDNVLPHRPEPVLQRLENRHEGRVDKHDFVFGVVDDVIQLLGEQPRIQGVANRTQAHDAEPGLHVPIAVPGHRRDPVAELDPFPLQGLGHAQRPLAGGCQRATPDRPLHAAADHFPFAVVERSVVQNGVRQ